MSDHDNSVDVSKIASTVDLFYAFRKSRLSLLGPYLKQGREHGGPKYEHKLRNAFKVMLIEGLILDCAEFNQGLAVLCDHGFELRLIDNEVIWASKLFERYQDAALKDPEGINMLKEHGLQRLNPLLSELVASLDTSQRKQLASRLNHYLTTKAYTPEQEDVGRFFSQWLINESTLFETADPVKSLKEVLVYNNYVMASNIVTTFDLDLFALGERFKNINQTPLWARLENDAFSKQQKDEPQQDNDKTTLKTFII